MIKMWIIWRIRGTIEDGVLDSSFSQRYQISNRFELTDP